MAGNSCLGNVDLICCIWTVANWHYCIWRFSEKRYKDQKIDHLPKNKARYRVGILMMYIGEFLLTRATCWRVYVDDILSCLSQMCQISTMMKWTNQTINYVYPTGQRKGQQYTFLKELTEYDASKQSITFQVPRPNYPAMIFFGTTVWTLSGQGRLTFAGSSGVLLCQMSTWKFCAKILNVSTARSHCCPLPTQLV